MNNNFNFSTFLFLSKKKITISVYGKNKFEKFYEKELLIDNQSDQINYNQLDKFLNDNIFRIEKILDNFIKKIILIIDTDKFFLIQLSIKKRNFEDLIDLKSQAYNDAT